MIGKKINQLATELAPVSTDLTIIGDPVSGVSKKITLAQLGAIFSGAVSFYTNLAAFPTPGTTDVIYCAKDTQKLYLWNGSAYTEVFPSQALLDTYQLRSEKGVSNGYASLDSGGKVPISQLPSSIMEYKGTWSASTNTPTLANGTGDTGDVYICNSPGSVNFGAGAITFAIGDYVIYSGTIWQRSSGAVGTVTSVAASITGDAIGITGSPVTTSGTLAFAFGGNSTQYINGAGNLITFPSIISQAANLVTEVYNKTGATLTKGTIVYINGGQGNLPTITKAIATGDSTSAQTFGIVQANITNNNNGYVVVAGRISDLDTQAYTEGTQLYLSSTTAGTWTSTKQYAPAHLVYVGIVVRAHPTQGVVEVKIQNGYELDEIHNVAAQTPSNNDGLFYESSTDLWKNKSIATILGYTPQAQLNGTGFVKASGTTITYDNSTYVTTDTFQNISASKTFAVGFNIASAGGTNQISVFANTNSLFSGSAGSNVFGFNSANNIYFGKGLDNGGVLSWNNSAVRYYTLPDATGTIALVGGSGVGTVTSVAALSLGTTGTDLNSTVTNSTTTPVITLNVPTASATNRGALSSTDWTTFNNKQNALTNPVTGSGTTNYLPKFTGTSTIGNSAVQEASGSIGINVSPVADLQVGKTSGVTIAMSNSSSVTSGTRGGLSWYNSNVSTVADIRAVAVTDNVGTQLEFYIRPVGGSLTQAMTLSASGNLGLGVTPSAWNTVQPVFQIGYTAFSAYQNTQAIYSSNGVYTSGWKYLSNTNATYYSQNEAGPGIHAWFNAPSGTAGNAISFTQAMTLDASGRLGIGVTNPSQSLHVAGASTSAVIVGNADGTTKYYQLSYNNSQANSRSWRFSNDVSVYGDFAIQQSTTQTGSSYSNLIYLSNTGAATFSSSVTANGTATFLGQFGNGNNVNEKIIQFTRAASSTDIVNIQGINAGVGAGNIALQASGGNVGIGTTSPTFRFDVETTNLTVGRFYSNAAGTRNNILIQNSGNYNYGVIGVVSATGGISGDVYALGYSASGSTAMTPVLNWTSGGNVGIGTTSPASPLHILSSSVKPQLIVDGGSGAGAGIAFNTSLSGSDRRNWFIGTEENIAGDFAIRSSNSAGGSAILGTTRFAILNNGNVGIGTTSPAKTLTVVNTAEQLRISYASGVYTDFRNDSAGGLLVNTSGGYIINYIGGTERLRIKTNTINITSIPTSSAGLSSGDLYSSAGVLMIV